MGLSIVKRGCLLVYSLLAAPSLGFTIITTNPEVSFGKSIALTWSDAPAPVNIYVARHTAADSPVVDSTVAEGITDDSFTWSPPTSLLPRDYLFIFNTSAEINYIYSTSDFYYAGDNECDGGASSETTFTTSTSSFFSPPTTSSSSPSGPSTTPTPTPTANGLSTGAKAGIGVGAGLGGLGVLGLGLLLVFRRGKAAGHKQQQPVLATAEGPKPEMRGDGRPVGFGNLGAAPDQHGWRRSELDASPPAY
ncbi:hypothetical protein F4808DRAFT_300978 [Astrocystis sublimbata]|nr:hypothetical protein F4808DRAFT_300978 [Astrocystis sublimbata]